MLYKATHCAGRILANTRPHQLRWGDREMGTAISCIECSQMAGLHVYMCMCHMCVLLSVKHWHFTHNTHMVSRQLVRFAHPQLLFVPVLVHLQLFLYCILYLCEGGRKGGGRKEREGKGERSQVMRATFFVEHFDQLILDYSTLIVLYMYNCKSNEEFHTHTWVEGGEGGRGGRERGGRERGGQGAETYITLM